MPAEDRFNRNLFDTITSEGRKDLVRCSFETITIADEKYVAPSDLVYERSALKAEQDSPLQEAHFAFFFAKQKEGRLKGTIVPRAETY